MIKTERSINIGTKRVAQVLAAGVAVLVLLDLVGQGLRYAGYGELFTFLGFIPEFDLNKEGNIPTYAATILLFLAGVLLSVVALFKKREQAPYATHWVILAAIFFFISMDEAATLHERLNGLVGAAAAIGDMDIVSGPFRFAWVIPAIILMAIFAFTYLRFLLHLPAKTRNLVALAGILYVGGALGLEMVAAWRYSALQTMQDPIYVALSTVEETLEMAGVVLFIYALLGYLQRETGAIHLKLGA